MLPIFLSAIESSDDAEMIVRLYQGYYALFSKTAFEITKNPSLTKDIVNEAFARTIQYIDRFRRLPYTNQISYINKVVRNTAYEFIKDQHYYQYFDDISQEIPEVDTDTIAIESYIELKEAIKRLSQHDQDLICLKYLGYREKEIAGLTGVKEKYIRQSIYRARQRIKKLLAEGVKINGKK